MKKARQETILRLIAEQKPVTQEELRQALNDAGFPVTQATISRDIRELRLTKAMGEDGQYHYNAGKSPAKAPLASLFREAVQTVDSAGNIVVVKCLSGAAGAVCAAADSLDLPQVLGTLAGDDTFICIAKTEDDAIGLAKRFRMMTNC